MREAFGFSVKDLFAGAWVGWVCVCGVGWVVGVGGGGGGGWQGLTAAEQERCMHFIRVANVNKLRLLSCEQP